MFTECCQFAPGEAQRLDIIAQDAFSRLFHAALESVNVLVRALLERAGLRKKTAVHQLRRQIERFVRVALVGLTERVVKLLRQQRFGALGLFGDAAHFVEEVGQAALLLRQLTGQFLPLLRVAQRFVLRVGERFEFLGQLLLFLLEFPGIAAHLPHIVGKPIRALFAKIVGELLQLALGARAGTKRL